MVKKHILRSEHVKVLSKLYEGQIVDYYCESGYRSIIENNVPDYSDYLYFEVKRATSVGCLRVGVASVSAEIHGPIGYDQHGYSLGTDSGYLYHRSMRFRYGSAISKSDILSCLYFKINNDEGVLAFFVNGEAYSKKPIIIKAQKYYPAISLYYGCSATLFVKKHFVYEEKVLNQYKPLVERLTKNKYTD